MKYLQIHFIKTAKVTLFLIKYVNYFQWLCNVEQVVLTMAQLIEFNTTFIVSGEGISNIKLPLYIARVPSANISWSTYSFYNLMAFLEQQLLVTLTTIQAQTLLPFHFAVLLYPLPTSFSR